MSNKSDKKKKKYPDSEMKPYNPFAVCTDSVGREDKDKYESCVQQVKQKNRDSKKPSKKDSKEGSKKSSKNASLEDRLMQKLAQNIKAREWTGLN